MSALQAPTEREKKYDRQLRLWGAHGQTALEQARVCLVTATAAGTECLKNLVLPGIGNFVVVDASKVTARDLGNNFFVTQEHLGMPRAQVTCELLSEMNPDVSGSWVAEAVEDILVKQPGFFAEFTVVVATGLAEDTLLLLGAELARALVPLLVVRAVGMLGTLRLVVEEHTVVEPHPDNAVFDFRLSEPWPELVAFCETFDLSPANDKLHHIPYAVLLVRHLEEWRASHDGKTPKTSAEKAAFKAALAAIKLQNEAALTAASRERDPESPPVLLENYAEAMAGLNQGLLAHDIDREANISPLFALPEATATTATTPDFWIMMRALGDFVAATGRLVLRGNIPDMHSDSDSFAKLQAVYKQKARDDLAVLAARVHELLQSVGRPLDSISEFELALFCKNAAFLRVVRCRPLAVEYANESFNAASLESQISADFTEQPLALWYILLRAADKFFLAHRYYPGAQSDDVLQDAADLQAIVASLAAQWGVTAAVHPDLVHEMCRYGGAEIHSVAAIMGGMAAQEVIKLITRQYVPISNTLLFSAVTGSTVTLEM